MSPSEPVPPRDGPRAHGDPSLRVLDATGTTRFQYRVMVISGMGFFTDAYDLFVIGIVVALLKSQWHLSTGQVSLLNSATLAASAVGAIVFGRIADVLGRKKVYGIVVMVLAIGAIASALAPGFWFLLVARIFLGIGIGGDYPVSGTLMSEYSGGRTRGRMVGLVFAMQGAGLVTGPAIAAVLLACPIPHDIVWRILLALGAIPGMAVYRMRRTIHETPRFAAEVGDLAEERAAIASAADAPLPTGAVPVVAEIPPLQAPSWRDGLALLRSSRLLPWLVATTSTWACLGFAYYGNTISSPEVLKVINPGGSLLDNTLVQLGIFAVFALPGYWLAVRLLDRMGRKTIQALGFAMMALAFLLIGLIPGVVDSVAPFLVLFGMSYLFTEFGPNVTTFVYPAELFPVEVRASADGISAAAGKLGAFVGAFLFPVLLASSAGLRGAEVVAGIVCAVGLVISVTMLPEPKGMTLEQIEAMGEARR